ncbi:transposase [Spiribacter halobius]|uniref:transposase n=1 Tax=Sediminicurvatus halobius TaxID=2182432 RepID=UPI0034E23C70
MAFALKRWEPGTPVAEVCRKMGVSDTTLYSWRKKHGCQRLLMMPGRDCWADNIPLAKR